MVLDASEKLCIFGYLILLVFLGGCVWRKYRYQTRPILLAPWLFIPLLVGLTALFTSLLGTLLLPIAIELSIGIIISLIHPIFAASFFLATFIIKPWEIFPESGLMIIFPRSLAAIALASLLTYLAGKRSSKLVFNFPVALFFAYMGWIFISAITAFNSSQSMEAFTSMMLPVIVTFLLVTNSAQEKLDLEIVKGSLIIAVLTLASIAYANTLWGWALDFSSEIPRLEGIGQWANANDLAALLVLALPLVLFPLILRSNSSLNRILGIFIVSFLLFGIWLSQSRGAMLAIAIGLLAYLVTCVKLKPRTLIISAVLLGIPIIFLSTIERDSSDLSGSSSMRLEYAMTGFRMLKTNPVTGVGFENYPKLYERYTTKFDEYGERTAHSSWILALAETGIPGLILILALFLVVLKRAFLVRKSQPELLISLVSYGTCMTLLSHSYQMPPYALLALIIAAKRLLVTSPVSQVSDSTTTK